MRALVSIVQEPDVMPSRIFGDGVGIKMERTK